MNNEERIKRLEKEIIAIRNKLEIIDDDVLFLFKKLKEKGILQF